MVAKNQTRYGVGTDQPGAWDWASTGNVSAADAAYTFIDPADPGAGSILRMDNYGFTVPASATIKGIVVETRSYRTGPDVTYSLIRLQNGGSYLGSNKAASENHPVGVTIYDFAWGSAVDLWGATLTPAIVNASTFGVDVQISSVGAAWNIYLDYARMTVYYEVPGGGLTLVGVG